MLHEPKVPVLREAEVYPHTLPTDQKRVFWEGLKVLRPGMIELMTKDAFVSELQGRFGAKFVFKKSEADAIYKAGLDAIDNQNPVKKGQ